MKTFLIKESKPSTTIWIYAVEAESETEALNFVLEKNPTPVDHEVEVDYEAKVEYEFING